MDTFAISLAAPRKAPARTSSPGRTNLGRLAARRRRGFPAPVEQVALADDVHDLDRSPQPGSWVRMPGALDRHCERGARGRTWRRAPGRLRMP